MSPAADEAPGSAVDRCPYSRSFTAAFADDPECPAFQGASFTVTDTANRPLGVALTCRHLTVGNDTRRAGRFYPRCGLGEARDRLRWLATVTPARLAVMRSLEEEFDAATASDRRLLLDAKARLLDGGFDAAAIEALEVRLSRFLDRVDDFIEERSDRLADIGLHAAQLQQLLADWSMAWLRSHRLFAPGIDGLRMAGLAPEAAAFLGAGVHVRPAVETSAQVVAEVGALAIERSEAPRVLHVRGEIDVSNSDAIATAVAGALLDAGDVTVDFQRVLFCDLSGLRTLVRAAQDLAEGQRILVTGLPEHLQHALRIVGWSDISGLVIAGSADPTERP